MSFCKWPNKGNVPSMIMELFEPENDWPTYPITIVSQYFDDYTKALKKEKELFISASESEKTPPRRKRKNKHNVAITNYNAEDSEDSPSQTPIKINKIINNNVISSAIKTMNFPPYENDLELSFQNNSSDMSQPLMDVTQHTTISNVVDLQNCSFNFDNNSYASLNKTEDSNEMFKKILELQMTTLEIVKRINAKLELLETKVNGNPIDNAYNTEFLALFPFKSKACIDAAEERLKEENFERQLKNYINQVGGTSLKNFVKRIFTKLFTNELATCYSWTGFRQNQPLHNLKLINIIKNTALKYFNGNESDFESHVKDWFRHASMRLSREKK